MHGQSGAHDDMFGPDGWGERTSGDIGMRARLARRARMAGEIAILW
jgi:hypothetical protein